MTIITVHGRYVCSNVYLLFQQGLLHQDAEHEMCL